MVLTEVLLQPFDPGLTLLHAPHVASLRHLLRDLRENVPILQAALQSPLHRVLPPDVQQVERLLIRPGNFSVLHDGERSFLGIYQEEGDD